MKVSVVSPLIRIIMLGVLLAGCQGEQVGSGLDQNKANHMMAVLSSHGIGAVVRKEAGGRGSFGVWVERRARSEAAILIDEQRLLEKGNPIEELISSQGILPGSREVEQIKVDRAVALEVERLLENIPGVVSARVVVRSSFLKEGEQPTVSVVVEDESGMQGRQDQLTTIVQSAVPGVARDRVLITLERSDTDDELREQIGVLNVKGKPVPLPLEDFLGLWRTPKDDYSAIAYIIVGLIVACASVGAVAGYWYSWYQQSRAFIDAESQGLIVPKVARMDVLKDQGKHSSIDLSGGEWTPKL